MPKVVPVPVGSVILDSLPWCMGTGVVPKAWIGLGEMPPNRLIQGFCGYLGVTRPNHLANLMAAGLGFMPVTFAGEYRDGAKDEIAQLKALGVLPGTTVWLDMEGKKTLNEAKTNLAGFLSTLSSWAKDIMDAGFQPGLYVGVPQPLTSSELYMLPFQRYWHGQGSVRDREGNLAEPFRSYQACRGWNMIQAAPSQMLGGYLVDYNMVYGDYRGQTPNFMVA